MVKTSKMLKSVQHQHCVAHVLHLLLMVDSRNTIHALVELITRLKTTIQRLDSKCYLLDDAKAKTANQEKMTVIQEKIARMQEVMNANERIALSLTVIDDDSENSQLSKQNELAIRHH